MESHRIIFVAFQKTASPTAIATPATSHCAARSLEAAPVNCDGWADAVPEAEPEADITFVDVVKLGTITVTVAVPEDDEAVDEVEVTCAKEFVSPAHKHWEKFSQGTYSQRPWWLWYCWSYFVLWMYWCWLLLRQSTHLRSRLRS
jgi:hypothetical protein